jgi:hypothetical protein
MALSDVQTIIENAVKTADEQIEKVDAFADQSMFAVTLPDPLKPKTQFVNLSATLGNDAVPILTFPSQIVVPQWIRYGGSDPMNDDILSIIKDLNDFMVIYGIDAIGPKLEKLFATYLTTYFPKMIEEDAGVTQVLEILANRGYTQPVVAEDAIFQRGRGRVINDGARAEADTISQWAQRGYSLPPGALMAQQLTARRKTQDAIAAVASDIVVKQHEMAVETYKFAIKETLEYRIKAFNSAVAYLQVFTSSILKNFGADAYAAILGARNQLYNTSLDLYKAMSANRATKASIQQGDNSVTLESWKAILGAFSELTRAQSSASIGAANAVGHIAAAAMAGINAAATISDTSSS